MAKHPNPLLAIFAEPEQDLFDILIIPLVTYLTYPVDFYSWVSALDFTLTSCMAVLMSCYFLDVVGHHHIYPLC
jgi:hypothetical protein